MSATVAIPLEASLIDRANFVTRFAAADPQNRCVARLHALFLRLDGHAAFSSQAEWLEDLAAWLGQRGRVPGRPKGMPTATARLTMLLDALDQMPEQLAALRMVVARAFEGSDGVRLFTDTGLPTQHGMFSEAIDRIGRRLLPEPPVEGDLGRLLFRLFPTQRMVDWFESLSPELSQRLFSALALPKGPALEPLRTSMRDAAVLLAVRISAHGLADDVRRRVSRSSAALRDSPFLALPKVVRAWAGGEKGATDLQCRETISACRRVAREVVATFDDAGVSVDLVYRLELINRKLDRLYGLLTVLSTEPIAGAHARLLARLIRGGVRDRSLTELLRTNSRLLAQRVIERAGHGGEHYVTRTRAEQHQMVDSAGGGGVLTAFSVLLKFLMGWLHLPPLLDGIGNSLNYATGFVTMQFFGLTLATKQPSMTAATLAHGIKETTTSAGMDTTAAPDLTPLVEQVARTVRSQLAAVVGNLGMVLPTVLLINLAIRLITGHFLLEEAYAEKIVAKHHLLRSPTLFYAMLTGVFLWLASMAGGTFENWFVVNKLPEAIASSRGLRALVGAEKAGRFSQFLLNNISGAGGAVALGFLLGMCSVLGVLIGIPIEVRHVTFATGQLTFSAMSLGPERVIHPDFLWAAGAVSVIALCNFGVSFALALFVALRAREVGAVAQLGLFRAVLRRFRQAPLDFIRAPANEVAGPPHPH